MVKTIQISIILMYPVAGRPLEMPMKLQLRIEILKLGTFLEKEFNNLQCCQNQKKSGVYFDNQVFVILTKDRRHLTDYQKHPSRNIHS